MHMTVEERLNNKFKEVLESRKELKDRLELQEKAVTATERVMEIFKHDFNGTIIQEIKMENTGVGIFHFSIKGDDGKFHYYCESKELERALSLAGYSMSEDIKDWVFEILDKYFEISEDSRTVAVIRI